MEEYTFPYPSTAELYAEYRRKFIAALNDTIQEQLEKADEQATILINAGYEPDELICIWDATDLEPIDITVMPKSVLNDTRESNS